MARKHGVIKVEVWEVGSEFRALKKDAQRTYIMLVSQPTINNLGLLDYTPERWVEYARDDSMRALKSALRELGDTNFVVVDERTRELLVRTFIRHDQIGEQPNLVKSAWRQFREVESMHIRFLLATSYPWLVGLAPSPCGESIEPLPEGLWKPLTEGVSEGVSEGVRPRARRALVTPTPTPTPSPEERKRQSAVRDAAGASTNGLPVDKDHELVKLLILIGNDAEQRTPDRPSTEDVLRSIAKDVPVGALAKVRESVQHERHKRPRAIDDFAAYAVGALQAERDSREA